MIKVTKNDKVKQKRYQNSLKNIKTLFQQKSTKACFIIQIFPTVLTKNLRIKIKKKVKVFLFYKFREIKESKTLNIIFNQP